MPAQLVILVGPTAVGKSALALELAARLDGEIISADSQLVYRGLNIGTAKPSVEERARIPHHLIDVADPDEDFNAAAYSHQASNAAAAVGRRKHNALVCGGTGLYIKALTEGLFAGPARDSTLRAAMMRAVSEGGLAELYRQLGRVDPDSTSWIHPNDRQRIIRALEVYQLTGTPMSQWHRAHEFKDKRFTTLKIGLDRERGDLYKRIDRRCEQMVAGGLLEEVGSLVAAGYGLDLKPLRSVGYRHMGLVLQGQLSGDAALALMQRDTRRLAKRQLTWFRRDGEIQWFHPEDVEKIFAVVAGFLASFEKEKH